MNQSINQSINHLEKRKALKQFFSSDVVEGDRGMVTVRGIVDINLWERRHKLVQKRGP